MKKGLFTLLFTLICLGSNAQLGYWVSGEFIELNLDESYDYRFVQAMDAESQNVLSNLYASMATKGNPSLLRIQDNQFFVDIDYCLPEGNYYESPIFKDTEGYNYIILPRLVLTLMDNFQIDDILEYLGNNWAVESSKKELNGDNTYVLTCHMKTAEDVLKAVKDIHDQDFPGIRMFEPNMYLFIYPQELAGVRNLKQNGSKETLYYSLDGRRLKSPAKGLNIIRQNDGTTRKVIVK